MLLWVFIFILTTLLGMGGVAFVTLLERKLLGLSQIRLGPNKASFYGILQPVADGVKLLLKEVYFVKSSQGTLFLFSPAVLMGIFIMAWNLIIPWWGNIFLMKLSSLLFFTFLGVSAYMIILVGWSSISAFSKLGSLRGVLQSLSFEVALILVFFSVLAQQHNFNMQFQIILFQELNWTWICLWFILSLMETNRAPFDLLEGESELISGFNIELGSVSFVFVFLSEYGMIIIMMFMLVLPFFGLSWLVLIFISLLLFMRSCFPRVRYDIMMSFMWLSLLPLAILFFIFSVSAF